MRIAIVVTTYYPYRGGIVAVAAAHADLLSGLGHEVTVFTPTSAVLNDAGAEFNYRIEYVRPWLRWGHGSFVPGLVPHLGGFDAVYLHYPFFGGAEPVVLAKMAGAHWRLFVHFHMDVPAYSPLMRLLSVPDRILSPQLMRVSEHITCASLDYLKESTWNREFVRDPGRITELPFGVDSTIFHPRSGNQNTVPRVIFVGGLDTAHHFKGLPVLLGALAKISLPWRLSVVGDGNLRSKMESLAKELNIEGKVDFHGLAIAELPQLYRESDLFVLPSTGRNEAFGLVLLEAMASGLPVIASSLPGVRTVFTIGEQGFLSRPGDANDLADKIVKLLADPGKRLAMGAAARRLAVEKYTWRHTAGKFKEWFGQT